VTLGRGRGYDDALMFTGVSTTPAVLSCGDTEDSCMEATLANVVRLASSSLDTAVSPEAGFTYSVGSRFDTVVKDITRRAYMVASLVQVSQTLCPAARAPDAKTLPRRVSAAGAGGRSTAGAAGAVPVRVSALPAMEPALPLYQQAIRWQIVTRTGALVPDTAKEGTALRVELAIRVALEIGASGWARGWDSMYATTDGQVVRYPGSGAAIFESKFFASSTAHELQVFVFEDLVGCVLAWQRDGRRAPAARAGTADGTVVTGEWQSRPYWAARDPFMWLSRCRQGKFKSLGSVEAALPIALQNAKVRARFVAHHLEAECVRRGVTVPAASWRYRLSPVCCGAHASVLDYYDVDTDRLVIPEYVLYLLCRQWAPPATLSHGAGTVPPAWLSADAPHRAGGKQPRGGCRRLRGLPVGCADMDLPVEPAADISDAALFGHTGSHCGVEGPVYVDPLPYDVIAVFMAVVAADCNRMLLHAPWAAADVQCDGTVSNHPLLPGPRRAAGAAAVRVLPRRRGVAAAGESPLVHLSVFAGNLQRHPERVVSCSTTLPHHQSSSASPLPAAESDNLLRLHAAVDGAQLAVLAYFRQEDVARASPQPEMPPPSTDDEKYRDGDTSSVGQQAAKKILKGASASGHFGLRGSATAARRDHDVAAVPAVGVQAAAASMVSCPAAAAAVSVTSRAAAAAPGTRPVVQQAAGHGVPAVWHERVVSRRQPTRCWRATWAVEDTVTVGGIHSVGDVECAMISIRDDERGSRRHHHLFAVRHATPQLELQVGLDSGLSSSRVGSHSDAAGHGAGAVVSEAALIDAAALLYHRYSACLVAAAQPAASTGGSSGAHTPSPGPGTAEAPTRELPRQEEACCRFLVPQRDCAPHPGSVTGAPHAGTPGTTHSDPPGSAAGVASQPPPGGSTASALLHDVSLSGRHAAIVHCLVKSALEDVSSRVTPLERRRGASHASARGDRREIATSSSSGERLLLCITRDIFAAAIGRQPFSDEVDDVVKHMLQREWTVRECQSVRWWILQTCLLGTLFPEQAPAM
jgi:hypothetical protein